MDIVPSEIVHKRLLYMEEELISVSHLILRSEMLEHDKEDVDEHHNFTKIAKFLEEVKPLNSHALENMSQYTAHPVGLYIITKRLAQDWRDVVDEIKESKLCVKVLESKISNIQSTMPDEKDMKEAGLNLLRLQRIHKLAAHDLARGKVLDNFTEPLTVKDCFDLGTQAVELPDFYYALEWYRETVRLCDEGKSSGKMAAIDGRNKYLEELKISTLLRIATIDYKTRNYKKAVESVEKIVALDPSHKMALNNLKFYKSLVGTNVEPDEVKPWESSCKVIRLRDGVCGGTIKKNPRAEVKLSCYYKPRSKAMFVRDKVEVVHRNPHIYLFHKVLPIKVTRPLIQGVNYKLTQTVIQDYGYTKERHWGVIKDDSKRARPINRIFTAITDIDYHRTEAKYLVFNIGTGIMELPLVDMKSVEAFGRNSTTFVIFLDDVEAGGETVFPWLKLKVKPEKGSALFFYNTKRNGEVNRKVLWGECPILLGRKWVAHKIYQEVVHELPKYFNLKFDLWAKW